MAGALTRCGSTQSLGKKRVWTDSSRMIKTTSTMNGKTHGNDRAR
jgi:hypothetical protein